MLLCYKSDRAITYVFCRDLHLTFMFSGLLQNDLFQVFQTKLLSHLSNKVCRLLSCPVLLRKFTNNWFDHTGPTQSVHNLFPKPILL